LKAGGIVSFALILVFLIYKEAIIHGLFPRLRQWQAFLLLCLLVMFVFAVTALPMFLLGVRDTPPSVQVPTR
jgi:hypothetical protein